jgi:hypothetical protein
MNKSLIIVRAGKKSLHGAWYDRGKPRKWDLYVCPFEPVPFESDPQSRVTVGRVIPGPKWTGLHTLLQEWQDWCDYDFIMLADDDLFALPAVWSKYFEILAEHKPALSQPALTPDSYFSHLITVQNPNFILRATTFVEIMLPCFRMDVFTQLASTFGRTQTGWGWGLDFLWPHMLKNRGIMIIDATPVTHTRPVRSVTDQDLKNRVVAETNAILEASKAPVLLTTLEGLTRDGRVLNHKDPEFRRLYTAGYADLMRRLKAKR